MKNIYLDKSSKNSAAALIVLTIAIAVVAAYSYMRSNSISADADDESAAVVAEYSTTGKTLLANLVLGINTIVNDTGKTISEETRVVSLAGQLVSFSEAREMGAISMIGTIENDKYTELDITDFSIGDGETFVIQLSDDTLNPKIVY